MDASEVKDSLICCQTHTGHELRATMVRVARHQVVFELYGAPAVLQLSEVLNPFKISLGDRLAYAGKAVITNLINTGTLLVCEATLEDAWVDLEFMAPGEGRLTEEFDRFLSGAQKNFKVTPNFRLVIAEIQNFLMDLQQWLEQIELQVRSQPTGSRLEFELETIHELEGSVVPVLRELFQRFEEAAEGIDVELRPAHQAYVKRHLHPLVLCAPFMYRTYQKPLGFAGDYEMVNMMVRPPYEGASIFAKVLNTYFLNTAPVIAHRNRVRRLSEILKQESARAMALKRELRVFNLGCGPAKEIQDFLVEQTCGSPTRFTLVDFCDEALRYTGRVLEELNERHPRSVKVELVKKSVINLVRESSKPLVAPGRYDLVYCAGLFDYLPDHVCQKLLKLCYDMVDKGGLVVATNVDGCNPCRSWMEYSVDWHLTYRDRAAMTRLLPPQAPRDEAVCVVSEASGVNIFAEFRKCPHGNRG